MAKKVFLILLFYPLLIYSQLDYLFEKSFIWKNKIYNINGEKNELLSFDGANIDGRLVPFYGALIPISDYNGGKIVFQIVSLKAQLLTIGEQKNVKINNLPIGSKYKISVYYAHRKPYIAISFYPLYRENGQIKKIVSIKIRIKESSQKIFHSLKYSSSSVLSSGKWVKIAIFKDGVYKITYEQLRNLGFSNPDRVRIFGNDNGMLPYTNQVVVDDDLVENKVFYGSDYILFYARGATRWYYDTTEDMFLPNKNIYTDTAYYFLTDKNTGYNNLITTSNISGNATGTVADGLYYDMHQQDLVNILHSGRIWLGENLSYTTTQTFSFSVPNVLGTGAKVRVALAARSSVGGSFTFITPSESKVINFTSVPGPEYSLYADYKVNTYDFIPSSSSINFTVNFNKPTASAEAWLDYIILNCRRSLRYNGTQFQFVNTENIGTGKITEFNITGANNNLMVWDITDSRHPVNISTALSGQSMRFKYLTDSLKQFIVFSPDDAYIPIFSGRNLGVVENQNIHSVSSTTQMLIITNKLFIDGAQRLADVHKKQGLNVFVATQEQIFNEFSSGMPDVSAIRNFVRYVYLKTNKNLRYVLLVGDGCYKNKCYAQDCPNYILTYQTFNSFNSNWQLSLVSDDFFGLLDDNEGELNGLMDVAVGRLPVKTNDELLAYLNKLNYYISPASLGDWRTNITIIADDEEGFAFMNDAENLSQIVDTLYPYFRIKKIYLDAYQQQTSAYGQSYPDVTVAINNRVKDGTLVMAFLGHGNMFLLTHEHILLKQDIEQWDNFEKLLFFITGTCEFGKFDEYHQNDPNYSTSAAEVAIINPNGGAIGMLTTVRPSYISINAVITDKFFTHLFDGTVGEAFIATKNSINDYNKHTFLLLADPALRLNYPYYNIRITDIQMQKLDTIRALDKVVVKGEVIDNLNNLLTDFQGVVYPTLLDKKQYLKTRDNDGIGAYTYWDMNNVLFRGQSSVINGRFSFSFIVPKDIDYNYGLGRFLLYAKSDDTDAKGYENIVVGGINPDAPKDNTGPRIRLFMNDTNFISGGITDINPVLLALLRDESGINTSSSGFGHSISAVLDNDNTKVYLLNDYYQADINTYKSGKVRFSFYKLTAGNHSVKLKAFDVYNNSSEATLDFVVEASEELKIEHLLNYPNPFTTHTSFYFDHNKPGIPLEVLLQIFTISGKLVKTFHVQMTTEGYRSVPIEWNGLDDFGNRIGRGVYIYKVKVLTPEGKQAVAYEKLLILR